MLEKIEGLPANVLGVRAVGKLTRDDYETVLVPLLEERRARGSRIRFLYHLGPDFKEFTAGAAVDDFRVGLRYLRLFERCAVVTDTDWIRRSMQLSAPILPCPVQVFRNDQQKEAVEWLASPGPESHLRFELSDDGILVVHPEKALRREDFDKLTSILDPWIETHHALRGLVIPVPKFVGWEVRAAVRHIEFVSARHRKILRVAVAVDGTLPE